MELSDRVKPLQDESLRSQFKTRLGRFSVLGTLASLILPSMLFVASCSKAKVDRVNLGYDMDSAYMMLTQEVDMLVSDSGQTKYRLLSPRWIIYDREDRKEWLFDQGIRMVTVDSLQPESEIIVADSAIFYVPEDEWVLIGNVKVHGLKGEKLYTPRLHWQRRNRKLFSNDTTYFATEGRILRGSHFEATDDLSWYTIYNNSGDFEVSEKPQRQSTNTTTKDSLPIGNPTSQPPTSLP